MPEFCGGLLTFKCILVGESAVGKTSYLVRLLTGEFPPTGNALKDEVSMIFHTNLGNIPLKILEASFKDLTGVLDCNDFDGVVVMCDISKEDHAMIREMPSFILNSNIDIPAVLIGNKRDAVYKGLKIDDSHVMPYFETSVKYNLNVVQPLQWMIRRLLNNDQIKFVEEYAPWPLEPLIDNCQTFKKWEPKLLTDDCEPEALEGKSQSEPSIIKCFLDSLFLDVALNSPLPRDNGIWYL
ncbi:GTP-binding nuclear protein Ran-like [Drosophila tropicalis]|uniref:GTP-binding nuclear protein Ran-like n=1 Tax=Drosophila tropicalis TaxID=46794 RepID=UPI0035ABDB0B